MCTVARPLAWNTTRDHRGPGLQVQTREAVILERMIDNSPQADRILVAELFGEARHHAKWRELTDAEEAAAVTELRELADGRADLLAEVAGILEGARESEPDEPLARQAAMLCRKAGDRPGCDTGLDRRGAAPEGRRKAAAVLGRPARRRIRLTAEKPDKSRPRGGRVPAGWTARYRRKRPACCGKSGTSARLTRAGMLRGAARRHAASLRLAIARPCRQPVNAVADAQDDVHDHPERDDEANADRLPGRPGVIERAAVVRYAVRLALE